MNTITSVLLDRTAQRLHGVAKRTSFHHAAQDIPALWADVLGADRLALRAQPRPIVAAYTDYASDHLGTYTIWLATAADPHAIAAPAGQSELMVPAGTYARFAADGDPTQVIWQVWQWINNTWANRHERTYGTDFEIHGVRGPNTADIYVGVR